LVNLMIGKGVQDARKIRAVIVDVGNESQTHI
jgi:hypothetical protein